MIKNSNIIFLITTIRVICNLPLQLLPPHNGEMVKHIQPVTTQPPSAATESLDIRSETIQVGC